MSHVGDVLGSERVQLRDEQTGARITQYTATGKCNRTLYFTNRPYVMDGRAAIFLSNRTGRNELFLVEFDSGKIVQVTDCGVNGNVSSCVHPHRPEVYYSSGTSIWRTRLDTLQAEELLRLPDGFRAGILNMNAAPWLAFECTQIMGRGIVRVRTAGDNGQAFPPGKPATNEGFYMRPLTLIYRYNVDADQLDCVWSEHKILTHVQLSPIDPNLVIWSSHYVYHSDDRCYYLDLSQVKRTPQRMFPAESASARCGHECFTRRGSVYAQWMQGDLRPGHAKTLGHAFRRLHGRRSDQVHDAPLDIYEIPEKSDWLAHHFTMSEDERWGLHDRWPAAPTPAQNMQHLSLFRHQAQQPQSIFTPVCWLGDDKGDTITLGAEATLDARDEYALYTSFRRGCEDVCRVDVRPFVEKLGV
jgi:oligogalacturonide lyase